jgi:hypothetical protein
MGILELPIVAIPFGLIALFTFLLFGGILIHVCNSSVFDLSF